MLPTPLAQTSASAGRGCERNSGLIKSSLTFSALLAKGLYLEQPSQPIPAKPQLPFLWDLGKSLNFFLARDVWLTIKITTSHDGDKGVSLLLWECPSSPPQNLLKIPFIPAEWDFTQHLDFCLGLGSVPKIWHEEDGKSLGKPLCSGEKMQQRLLGAALGVTLVKSRLETTVK